MSYLKNLVFKKAFVLLVVFILLILFIFGANKFSTPVLTADTTRTWPNDLVYVPENIRDLEAQITLQKGKLGWEPGWAQTSDFMLGTVTVSIILPECNGQIDPCTQQGWAPADVNQILSEVQIGLNWWEARASDAGANVDFQIAAGSPLIIPTSYEPIDRPGGGISLCGEEELWVDDVMANLGYNNYPPGNSSYLLEVREYDNYLREQNNTDWGVTIFVADASEDADGFFAETTCGGQTVPFAVGGWGYFAGPFLAMNNINGTYGSIFMDGIVAHELGHIFGAPDEVPSSTCKYNMAPSCTTQFGYLGGENQNCNPCMWGGCTNPCAIDETLSIMRTPGQMKVVTFGALDSAS